MMLGVIHARGDLAELTNHGRYHEDACITDERMEAF